MSGFDSEIKGDSRTGLTKGNGIQSASESNYFPFHVFFTTRPPVFPRSAKNDPALHRNTVELHQSTRQCVDVFWKISGLTLRGNSLHTRGTPWRNLPCLPVARSSRHRRHKSRRRLYRSGY